jgi:hypothetical protein
MIKIVQKHGLTPLLHLLPWQPGFLEVEEQRHLPARDVQVIPYV